MLGEVEVDEEVGAVSVVTVSATTGSGGEPSQCRPNVLTPEARLSTADRYRGSTSTLRTSLHAPNPSPVTRSSVCTARIMSPASWLCSRLLGLTVIHE